jgi:hypothetical protein
MWRRIRVALLLALALGAAASAQQLDICGCKNSPASLGSFDSLNAATYPPGTISAFRSLQIPLPPDGVLVFNSINLQPRPTDSTLLTVSFIKNAANTPVTLLVSGNVTIAVNTTLSVGGDDGVHATTDKLGTGGNGGPGGNRGGDGAYQLVNFASIGGAGLGPSGGAGGTGSYNSGIGYPVGGAFVSASDLLPLVGGSGGGGGGSITAAPNCAGGGGGGGGGALLMASNATITLNGEINADGGQFGNTSNGSCASYGASGSGGAVRLLANTLAGTGRVFARGGTLVQGGRAGIGAIRAEALNNTMNVSATDPLAARTPGPGAITNIVNPSVSITAVAGQAIAATPQGSYGGVDLILPVAGPTTVDFSTSGVPTGTTVNVTVKPRVGGAPATNTIALVNCDGTGHCLATTSFTLAAGSYFVEARATFQTP